MRYWLSKRIPPFSRVVLVESGSRHLLEDLLPGVYELYGSQMRLDLVTCYNGTPTAFRPEQGQVYRITDYPATPAGRAELVAKLQANQYTITGIICSDEPIMTKWKWMLAVRLPGKLFILNENGDYFWADRGHAGILWHFLLFRAGLTGASAVVTLGRLLLFPFTFLFLALWCGKEHLLRRARA